MLHFAWKEGSRVGGLVHGRRIGITFFDSIFALDTGCRMNANAMIHKPSLAHVCGCRASKPDDGRSELGRVYYG